MERRENLGGTNRFRAPLKAGLKVQGPSLTTDVSPLATREENPLLAGRVLFLGDSKGTTERESSSCSDGTDNVSPLAAL